jgi:potassium efflux system protein
MDVDRRLSAPSKILTAILLALLTGGQTSDLLATQGSDSELLVSSRRIFQEPSPDQFSLNQQETGESATPETAPVSAAKRDPITFQLIDEELAKVEKAELADEEKGAILKHYLAARQFITQANSDAALAAGYREESQNAIKQREQLRASLNELQPTLAVDERLPDELTELEKLKLKREDAVETLQEKQKAVSDEPNRRATRLKDLSTYESETQNELAEIRVQLATEAPESDNPMLTRARMVELRAKKQSLEQSLDLFRVERIAYEATAGNWTLQTSLATAQLEQANARLKAVDDAIGRIREEETDRMLRESLQDFNTLSSRVDASGDAKVPESVAELAKYNYELAQQLTSETDELHEMKTSRGQGQEAVQKIDSELKTMQSRVEAIGLSYEVGSMLRRDKSKLINQQAPFLNIDIEDQLQEVQLKKFRWQDERKALTEISLATANNPEVEQGPRDPELKIEGLIVNAFAAVKGTPKLESEVADLVESGKRLLEKLEDTETDRLHDLIEVRSLQSKYAAKSQEFADFLDERILWVRSEPALGMRDSDGVGDLEAIAKGTQWFTLPENWKAVGNAIVKGAKAKLPSFVVAALGLLGLVLIQPRSRKELNRVGEIAVKRGCREFSPTVSGFFQSSLLAFFWPAIGLTLGWLISTQNMGTFCLAIGRALTITSLVALPLEMIRCICRKAGLAQNHFSWSEGFRQAIRLHTGWFMAIGLPLLFLIVTIETSSLDKYNRLGRVAMMGLLTVCLVYAFRIHSVFRLGGSSYSPDVTGFDATVSRIRSLFFLAIVVGFVMLFLFAVLGYYESVYKIGASLLQTLQLVIWTVIAFGLAMRFFLVRRRKLRFEQLIQQRKAALAAAEKQAESGMAIATEALDIDLQAESGMDITEVSRQARELTGVIFLIAIGLSLLGIWQYLLPATKILDSWELWRITVGSAVEFVTARDLLLSLVTFAITFFSVRNIPGMLELVLLQRLPLDAGARYAVASIFRYILLVVGVIVALGFLKIPWSNYSWLVAAVSVGLGFGLQEIVANFVSGLILLLERPVRVGDVVTIDGVTGIVSRIQMRATTVTNWDNQELVVPNKDLISGKLLNWTLSSVINRITLKVGVAYGTDVGRVREIITKIVDRHPDVLKDPPAIITFEEFGDNSLNFVIRCCTTTIKRRWHLIDEINSAVNEAFEREGIEIPFPQRVVHLIDETGVEPDEES